MTIKYLSDLRQCSHCGEHKPADAFYRSRPKVCAKCVRARVAEHRKQNIERIREYDRSRGYRGGTNNDKLRARNAARKLVRNPCEVCGEAKADAHHDDYSNPLDVRWLCRPHHGELHRKYA